MPHQMWHDHPFSERNKTTEREMGVVVGDGRERGGGGVDKIWKRGSRKYREGLLNFLTQLTFTCSKSTKETLEINNKNSRTTSITLNIPFSSVSTV